MMNNDDSNLLVDDACQKIEHSAISVEKDQGPPDSKWAYLYTDADDPPDATDLTVTLDDDWGLATMTYNNYWSATTQEPYKYRLGVRLYPNDNVTNWPVDTDKYSSVKIVLPPPSGSIYRLPVTYKSEPSVWQTEVLDMYWTSQYGSYARAEYEATVRINWPEGEDLPPIQLEVPSQYAHLQYRLDSTLRVGGVSFMRFKYQLLLENNGYQVTYPFSAEPYKEIQVKIYARNGQGVYTERAIQIIRVYNVIEYMTGRWFAPTFTSTRIFYFEFNVYIYAPKALVQYQDNLVITTKSLIVNDTSLSSSYVTYTKGTAQETSKNDTVLTIMPVKVTFNANNFPVSTPYAIVLTTQITIQGSTTSWVVLSPVFESNVNPPI